MKKLIVTTLLLVVGIGVQADGRRYYGGHHSHGSPRVSFYWGGGCPSYSPWSSYSYFYYPSYGYGSDYSYSGSDYSYSRPNYAVNGTLTGALLGGIIGNSVHHQGWEGAGIGAAAGLLLGGLAERNARAYERNYSVAPAVSYVRPNYIADAPTVNPAPTVPDAPQVQSAPVYKPASNMSSANSLFGR